MARSYTRPPRLDAEDSMQDPNADAGPWPSPSHDESAAYERGRKEAEAEFRARQEAEQTAIQDAARAFSTDWSERDLLLKDSPIIRFLKAHEVAGSPNELTITGVADVRVSLGDLRAFVRGLE